MSTNPIWVRLNAADVTAGTNDAKAQHEKTAPGCKLSITWNVAQTEALVKIDGGKDAAWEQGRAWLSNAIAIYDKSNRYDIFKWFYTPEWQPKDADILGDVIVAGAAVQ